MIINEVSLQTPLLCDDTYAGHMTPLGRHVPGYPTRCLKGIIVNGGGNISGMPFHGV